MENEDLKKKKKEETKREFFGGTPSFLNASIYANNEAINGPRAGVLNNLCSNVAEGALGL